MAHSRSSIKIQDGCNNSCTYCAIHLARGKSVSLDVESVLNRVIQLEKVGQKEVVFTTVNINHYRGEYNGKYLKFAELLDLCLQKTSTIAFRISSLYPEVVDDYFCSVIKNPRVRPHFHISVQSGSNKILKLMNRTYERDAVEKACKLIRTVKKNPFIACDIITGFPGETDEDFEQTLDLCENCQFTWIHIFPFSERKGTVAITLKNKVPQEISKIRCNILTKWAVQQKIKYIESLKGCTRTAILEMLRKPSYTYHCVTDNFLHCQIKYPKDKEELPQGTKVQIVIDSAVTENIQKGGEVEVLAHLL
jgi:threonylcarbamoyladenosine tRNA methylthiotransferase MtaB